MALSSFAEFIFVHLDPASLTHTEMVQTESYTMAAVVIGTKQKESSNVAQRKSKQWKWCVRRNVAQ